MVDWILTRAVYAVLFARISTLAVNSRSQNSIHPRNTSTENAHGDQTCQLDSSDMNSRNRWSPCKIPCKKDDDCINYGRHICCPTLPGSSCVGECLLADIKTDSSTKMCVDVRTQKRFTSGETFILDHKCCTCEAGRIKCSTSSSNVCHLGCKRDLKYFKHGESIPSRPCQNCSCQNGSIICSSDVNCLQGKCNYRGKLYEEGELLILNRGCKECVCRARRWNCVAITCSVVQSKGSAPSSHHAMYLQTAIVSLLTYTLKCNFCS